MTTVDPVTRISWRGFRVPFREAFLAAHGAMTAREGFIVEVEAASGRRGIGEASPLPSFAGGSLEETARALEVLAVGDVPVGLADGSVAAARCGLETAIADLTARQSGLGLSDWLTGGEASSESAPLQIPVNAVIDLDTAARVAQSVARAVADGFPAIKLKVGGDPTADAARVAAAREAGGPSLEIRVDANRAWSRADAFAFLSATEPHDVALCEEPLVASGTHFEALAALRSLTSIPLGIDESCASTAALSRAIELGAADTLVLKPMVTGLSEALSMLLLAADFGLRVIVTTTFDTGIGTALATHVASLLPEPMPACGLATLDHLDHPLVLNPPLVRDGAITLPAGPGLGVELDPAALERYASGLTGEVRL